MTSLTLANSPVVDTLIWVVVLIALILVGSLGVFALRRSILGDPAQRTDNAGMLEQLRRMVERGEMSQAEYDQARRAIIQKASETKASGDPDAG